MPSQAAPTPRSVPLKALECYQQGKNFIGNDYALFLGLIFVGLIVGGLVPVILLGPAWCGIVGLFLAKERRQPISFNTLFEGFNDFVAALIAAVCYVGMSIVAAIPYIFLLIVGGILASAMDNAIGGMLGFLCFLTGIIYFVLIISVINLGLFFSCALIAEYKLEGLDAVKLSYAGIQQNLSGVTIVAIVGQLIIMLGTMLCIIPGLLAVPIVIAGHFICYRKIFGGGEKTPVAPVKHAM